MSNDAWDPSNCALVGSVLGPSALLALWLSSMIPWPGDALVGVSCFFAGAIAGAASFAAAALMRNALLP